MLEKQQKLEINPEELAVIESALHTQSKILDVQANAGAAAARSRLNEVKRVLARLDQQKPAPKQPRMLRSGAWFSMSRLFG